jgi:hypothetical protein
MTGERDEDVLHQQDEMLCEAPRLHSHHLPKLLMQAARSLATGRVMSSFAGKLQSSQPMDVHKLRDCSVTLPNTHIAYKRLPRPSPLPWSTISRRTTRHRQNALHNSWTWRQQRVYRQMWQQRAVKRSRYWVAEVMRARVRDRRCIGICGLVCYMLGNRRRGERTDS